MKKEYDLKKLKPRPGAAKVPISIRVDGSVLSSLKSEAERLGLPYQTHIGSLLHQYVHGELIEKKAVALLNKLKAL